MRVRFWLVLVLAAAVAACNSSKKSSSAEPAAAVSKKIPAADDDPLLEDADPRESALAQAVARMLESQHVRQLSIDDATSRKAFQTYLERLDPDKVFFLREDVRALSHYEDEMDDQMRAGHLKLAHVANERFSQRLRVVEDIVGKRLEKPFDYSLDESLETDAEKIDYASSDAELKERWRKRLKLEVLGRVVRMENQRESLRKALKTADEKEEKELAEKALAKIPAEREAREKKAREDLAKSYSGRFVRLGDKEALELTSGFINAVAGVFDPHTAYMPPAAKDNFDIQMTGSLEGIGAILSEDAHYIRVMELVPGGASWRQGELEAGDLIMAVAQEGQEPVDVGDMRINKVVKMIRGKAGTQVTLTVKKSDDSIKNIAITRDVVEIEAAYARGAILESKSSKKRFGYISLPSFYGNTRAGQGPDRRSAADVEKLLKIFVKRKVDGAIVDVRGNGGGLLDDARQMTGHFIESGPVVQTRLPDGTLEVLADEDPSVVFDKPVVVMVDRFSASASEILAGALQDYGRAVIVGPGPTHGKGTVQALLDLSRVSMPVDNLPMGVLKLTVQQFFRVNGASTQWKGVSPDIQFPDPAEHIESGERHLDHSIPWSKVGKLEHKDWDRARWDLKALRERSEKRRADSTAFQKVRKRSTLLKERTEETLISLNRGIYKREEEAHRQAIEKLAHDEKRVADFSAQVLNYDGHKPPKSRDGKEDRDPAEVWKESLLRDFMLNEAVLVVQDMTAP